MSDYLYAGFLVEKFNSIKTINKRIEFLYNINTNINGKIKMPQNADIHIKDLTFRYKGQKENVLENINLDIKAGSFIGILGKTGEGKTTLANILAKFYEIPNNQIFYNDVDINEIERHSFYNKFAYVMQDDYIYDNTIKHNIVLYKVYTDEQLEETLKQAELFNTVEKLENKCETLIGENGIKLSGGQKQRLILSRNLITNPSILVIDNGFTGLDIETRKKVIQNLSKNDNKTTLAPAYGSRRASKDKTRDGKQTVPRPAVAGPQDKRTTATTARSLNRAAYNRPAPRERNAPRHNATWCGACNGNGSPRKIPTVFYRVSPPHGASSPRPSV